jgi:hypothetical protein
MPWSVIKKYRCVHVKRSQRSEKRLQSCDITSESFYKKILNKHKYSMLPSQFYTSMVPSQFYHVSIVDAVRNKITIKCHIS